MERVNSTVERVGKRIRKLEDSTEEFIRMTVRWNTYKHTHTHTHTQDEYLRAEEDGFRESNILPRRHPEEERREEYSPVR
jgi:hypothetical protein